MEDDFDIYDDIDNFDDKDPETLKRNAEFVEKITALEDRIKNLEEELTNSINIKNTLEINLSSLLKTAKTELARKDRAISELRKQLDDAHFRRNNRYRIPKIENKPETNYQQHQNYQQPFANSNEDTTHDRFYYVRQEHPAFINNSKSITSYISPLTVFSDDDGTEETNQHSKHLASTVFGQRLQKRLKEEEAKERSTKEQPKFIDELNQENTIETKNNEKLIETENNEKTVVENKDKDNIKNNNVDNKENQYRLIPCDINVPKNPLKRIIDDNLNADVPNKRHKYAENESYIQKRIDSYENYCLNDNVIVNTEYFCLMKADNCQELQEDSRINTQSSEKNDKKMYPSRNDDEIHEDRSHRTYRKNRSSSRDRRYDSSENNYNSSRSRRHDRKNEYKEERRDKSQSRTSSRNLSSKRKIGDNKNSKSDLYKKYSDKGGNGEVRRSRRIEEKVWGKYENRDYDYYSSNKGSYSSSRGGKSKEVVRNKRSKGGFDKGRPRSPVKSSKAAEKERESVEKNEDNFDDIDSNESLEEGEIIEDHHTEKEKKGRVGDKRGRELSKDKDIKNKEKYICKSKSKELNKRTNLNKERKLGNDEKEVSKEEKDRKKANKAGKEENKAGKEANKKGTELNKEEKKLDRTEKGLNKAEIELNEAERQLDKEENECSKNDRRKIEELDKGKSDNDRFNKDKAEDEELNSGEDENEELIEGKDVNNELDENKELNERNDDEKRDKESSDSNIHEDFDISSSFDEERIDNIEKFIQNYRVIDQIIEEEDEECEKEEKYEDEEQNTDSSTEINPKVSEENTDKSDNCKDNPQSDEVHHQDDGFLQTNMQNKNTSGEVEAKIKQGDQIKRDNSLEDQKKTVDSVDQIQDVEMLMIKDDFLDNQTVDGKEGLASSHSVEDLDKKVEEVSVTVIGINIEPMEVAKLAESSVGSFADSSKVDFNVFIGSTVVGANEMGEKCEKGDEKHEKLDENGEKLNENSENCEDLNGKYEKWDEVDGKLVKLDEKHEELGKLDGKPEKSDGKCGKLDEQRQNFDEKLDEKENSRVKNENDQVNNKNTEVDNENMEIQNENTTKNLEIKQSDATPKPQIIKIDNITNNSKDSIFTTILAKYLSKKPINKKSVAPENSVIDENIGGKEVKNDSNKITLPKNGVIGNIIEKEVKNDNKEVIASENVEEKELNLEKNIRNDKIKNQRTVKAEKIGHENKIKNDIVDKSVKSEIVNSKIDKIFQPINSENVDNVIKQSSIEDKKCHQEKKDDDVISKINSSSEKSGSTSTESTLSSLSVIISDDNKPEEAPLTLNNKKDDQIAENPTKKNTKQTNNNFNKKQFNTNVKKNAPGTGQQTKATKITNTRKKKEKADEQKVKKKLNDNVPIIIFAPRRRPVKLSDFSTPLTIISSTQSVNE